MEFQIQYLSFFVIQVEGKGELAEKRYKHYQTMNEEEYENSRSCPSSTTKYPIFTYRVFTP